MFMFLFTDFCSCLYNLFQHSVRGNLEAEDVTALLSRLVSTQVQSICYINLTTFFCYLSYSLCVIAMRLNCN